jgi:MYXO-CTERM domain-containing protein
MKVRSLLALALVAGAATSANALTFECRFVEQTGPAAGNFVVLPGNVIDATNGAPRRIRMQFRVVDDGMGPAPAGGFVGQNVGTLTVSGAAGNSQERRTNGRISPFNFAGGANSNGNPPPAGGVNAGDAAGADWEMLTDIDNTLGTQAFAWGCDASGNPLPQPQAVVRGRNTFVSIFEFTINPIDVGGSNYTITAGGNLIAATSWLPVGNPTAPDCSDPDNPVNGSVTYAPFPTAPTPYSCVLSVTVPAPGAAALLGLGGLLVARRRRA